jgi:hypothetical protein
MAENLIELREHPPHMTEILLDGVRIGVVFPHRNGTSYQGILTLEDRFGTDEYPTMKAAIDGIRTAYEQAPAKYKRSSEPPKVTRNPQD